ncbi:TPA: hypothetical protein P5S08_003725 [Salmonella enterica subsp. enterica serovar Concord]|nr:hypothetical protein [Salmonella enterica subsp. enterica serovar Concord]
MFDSGEGGGIWCYWRRWCERWQTLIQSPDVGYPAEPSPARPLMIPTRRGASGKGERAGVLARESAPLAGDSRPERSELVSEEAEEHLH